MSSDWSPSDVPSLADRVVVVTGANSGVGLEGTRRFAERGATVVMACRSLDRGEAAAAEVRADDPAGELDVRHCDLADLDSVAEFAADLADAYDRLDVLCNNAGVMALPRAETADGYERQFAVNHLGHFALTGHLLGALASTPGAARVVTQSSMAHRGGRIDFGDLHGEIEYDRWDAYAQSKLANVLFALELDRRCRTAALDVTSLACHPGFAATNLQTRMAEATDSRLIRLLTRLGNVVVAQSAREGANPMVRAATDPSIDGGAFVGPGGFYNSRGPPTVQDPADQALDEGTAAKLWSISEELTGVRYDFDAAAAASD